MYIVEGYPEKLHSKVLKILESSIGEDSRDGRMPLQTLQKQSLVIQEGVSECKSCSGLLECHDLTSSYLSGLVNASLRERVNVKARPAECKMCVRSFPLRPDHRLGEPTVQQS